MKLGIIVALEEGPEEAIARVHQLGFPTCQVSCWHPDLLSAEAAQRLRTAAAERHIEITSIWAGMPGRVAWNFAEGPETIGIVPPKTRASRLRALKRASDFARMVDVASITTHVGFIPENMTDTRYLGTVKVLREIALHCQGNGQSFWFETGQETPVVLLRIMQDIGTPNLAVNLDPANLLMYGKANPVDALDVIGSHVKGVHAKDGEYPTDGYELGVEKPIGQGRVNFPLLLARLKASGYDGALTIEREIGGPQQRADIESAKDYLEKLLASL